MTVRIIANISNHNFPIGTILTDVSQLSDLIFCYNEPGNWRWFFLKEEIEIFKTGEGEV
jgi:hypothetical protein